MTPKQKIEALTRSWYGYSLFAAVLAVLSIRASGPLSLMVGLGLSIAINGVLLVLSLALVAFLGRKLLHRSNGTRVFLVVVSGLGAVLGALGTLNGAWQFLQQWSIAAALNVLLLAACTMVNARSFRTLTETGTRSYFV